MMFPIAWITELIISALQQNLIHIGKLSAILLVYFIDDGIFTFSYIAC
jgi:hypothetical protein